MLQLSYWLFPLVFIVFLFFKSMQAFLLPGLIAACVAGAANSVVVKNYPFAAAHGYAAALCIFLAARSEKPPRSDREVDTIERVSAVVAWALIALVACYIISDASWPYVLSKRQMLVAFIPFLPVGVVA